MNKPTKEIDPLLYRSPAHMPAPVITISSILPVKHMSKETYMYEKRPTKATY